MSSSVDSSLTEACAFFAFFALAYKKGVNTRVYSKHLTSILLNQAWRRMWVHIESVKPHLGIYTSLTEVFNTSWHLHMWLAIDTYVMSLLRCNIHPCVLGVVRIIHKLLRHRFPLRHRVPYAESKFANSTHARRAGLPARFCALTGHCPPH